MSLLKARQLAEVSATGAVIGVLGGAAVGGPAAPVGHRLGSPARSRRTRTTRAS